MEPVLRKLDSGRKGHGWQALPVFPSVPIPRGIYFNKKIFEQAGLPTDWQPKNWDEILSAARTIKEKVPGVIPMNIYAGRAGGEQTTMQGFEMLLYGTQDTLYNTDTNKWVSGSQGFKDALTFYQTAYSEGLTPSNDVALDKAVGTRVSTELLPQGASSP